MEEESIDGKSEDEKIELSSLAELRIKERAVVVGDINSDLNNHGGTREDTSAGAVDNRGQHSTKPVVERPLDSSEDLLEFFSCEEAGCVWPCGHHLHVSEAPDFSANLRDVAIYADFGCSFCGLFRAVTRSRCACRRAQSGGQSIRGRRHRCRSLTASFIGRVLSRVTFDWDCTAASEMHIEFADPTGTVPFLPKIQGSIHIDRLSPESIALYKGWIDKCETLHPKCPPVRTAFAPLRLLDVDVRFGLPGVKLWQTMGYAKQYIALSYRWGDRDPLKTKRCNLSDHQQYISWAIVPKSYQDTIMLARKLGIRYVWIDSLCIVQDDPGEKDSEIRRMGEIYRQAYLVVIAAHARDSYSGYLDPESNNRGGRGRDRLLWQDFVVRYQELSLITVKTRQMLFAHRIQRADACSRQLTQVGSRAWTYQERLLANRCLIFQNQDVVWECKTACYCECSGDRSTIPGEHYRPQMLLPVSRLANSGISKEVSNVYFESPNDAYDFWKGEVKNFSGRDVSKPTDRLPAISALASAVHDVTKDHYLAGLWRADLAEQLLWICVALHSEIIPFQTYVAPSWSWVSIKNPTRYVPPPPSHLQQRLCPFAIIEAHCTNSGANPFGPVTDGYLVVEAIHCKAYAAISRSNSNSPSIKLVLDNRDIHSAEGTSIDFLFLDRRPVIAKKMFHSGGHCSSVLERDPNLENHVQSTCSGEVRLLWIEEDACLLLCHSNRVSGAFERLGILQGSGLCRDEPVNMAPPPPSYSPSMIKLV